MTTLLTYMADAHAQCDELFTQAENLAVDAQWTELKVAFEAFTAGAEAHFKKEEQVLFPRVEAHMGTSVGPIQVMLMEHRQIRVLITNLSALIDDKNRDVFLGEAETLLIMLQQHNMKEEQILYPMIDGVLDTQIDAVIHEMEML